jgi:orotidine-5'-phosphate decarboxylase
MSALEKLQKKNQEGKFICIGLDTDLDKIPQHLRSLENPILEFNSEIIRATSDFAAAYKLNFAFYEENGYEGFKTLEKTISIIPDDLLIIGDAKRGDIGNTSKKYAESLYNYFKFDAATINPYMGEDSVQPFLEIPDKLNFILALTSNPGSKDFEKLKLDDGSFLFQEVIRKVNQWNAKRNCGIVFGATNIIELKENLSLIGDLPVLLPGVGAQGGSLEDVIRTFKENHRFDFLINISRGIIYKDNRKTFAETAKEEIAKLNHSVKSLLS